VRAQWPRRDTSEAPDAQDGRDCHRAIPATIEPTGRKTDSIARREEYLRVLPALVVNLVHVAVALVVGILGLDIEYLGLIQELEVEAEHFLILGVLGIVSLGWSHSRKIRRVVLSSEFSILYVAAKKLESWWMFAAMVVALTFTGIWERVSGTSVLRGLDHRAFKAR
jgi:hypothetical protein